MLLCLKFIFSVPPVEISTKLVTFIENETCDQRQNQMWRDLHIIFYIIKYHNGQVNNYTYTCFRSPHSVKYMFI